MLARFANLLARPAERGPADARVPDGVRVYAIGDVHGRRDLLDALLMQIGLDDADRGRADTRIVLLGDLVDRGPDSMGCVARAMELAARGATVLLGNHEAMFLDALDDVEALRHFLRVGGQPTILSYGLTAGMAADDYVALTLEELHARLPALVPPDHADFLRGLPLSARIGDYLFVHAGLRPGVPLAEQRREDMIWIRDRFLDSNLDHGAVVVHGHSIAKEVEERPNRIGIDTGAYASGRLTAVCLEGGQRWYLQTGGAG